MAEGVVMDAVVQVLVRDVTDAVYVHGQYVFGFQTQFEDMKRELSLMRAFLTDTEKIKGKYKTLKPILDDLRKLVYDADDLVMDCIIRAKYWKSKGTSSSYHLSPRELLFRYQTGRKLTCVNKRIVRLKGDLNSYLTPVSRTSEGSSSKRRFNLPVFNQSDVVGLTEDVETIKGWIFLDHKEELHRIGIVGMAGLGKTTIAQKIFEDKDVIARFKERIWVTVSQNVDENEIVTNILDDLKVNDRSGNLLLKISEVLTKKAYLIVMDDVWKTGTWWEKISSGLPETKEQSSCIIITSRNEDVLKGMGVVEERIHRPKLLNEEEGWSLFCKVAKVNSALEETGKNIVKKCGGLPLAIKTIGGLLKSKNQILKEWERIYLNFHAKLEEKSNSSLAESNRSSVMASLQLSYDELPTDLKHCILCFSIYAEDYEISAEQLVRWWVGEGFVRDEGTETARDVAYENLSELISRCLVEVVQRRNYDGKVYNCKMHDLVRDLTIKIAREEDFSSFDKGNRQVPTVNTRRLRVTGEMDLHALDGNSKLRALLCMPNCSIRLNRSRGLAKVRSLRVLDFSHIKLDKISLGDLWRWITSQKRLAYLNLRNAAKLVELPDSIGKLWALQILILGECKNLKKVSVLIATLSELTVLDVGNCPLLQCLPQGLSRLSNLQELYGFKIASSTDTKGCHLGELKDLPNLRVLQVDIKEESIIKVEEVTVLAQLNHLRVLSINAGDSEDKDILRKLDMLCLPTCLEELYLRHYFGESTPQWMNPTSLPQLQYLCIEDSKVLSNINNDFWGKEDKTWKIVGLCLKFLPKLEVEWSLVQRGIPSLRFVEVSHCNSLKSFPCNVEGLGIWRRVEKDKVEEEKEEIKEEEKKEETKEEDKKEEIKEEEKKEEIKEEEIKVEDNC
ncbi:unnamed protein product [Ilex paraguariensis]|uniref:Uncharacterized protein n=1 Tax=Ilex paraguariensis TaxID=185542 RepID=A0ABC8T8L1_9AQUA